MTGKELTIKNIEQGLFDPDSLNLSQSLMQEFNTLADKFREGSLIGTRDQAIWGFLIDLSEHNSSRAQNNYDRRYESE